MKTIIKSRKPFFPSCIMVLGTLASPECGACGDTASGFTYTLLLLHGLPSSSRMFEPLFDRLADRYHLIAPDYPGFGHSDWPNPKEFAYTFDRYAEIMARFTEALAIPRYTLYMQDYGGPVGFRMALTHPERRAWSELENSTSVLGRPEGQRECASHQPPLASRHAHPPPG